MSSDTSGSGDASSTGEDEQCFNIEFHVFSEKTDKSITHEQPVNANSVEEAVKKGEEKLINSDKDTNGHIEIKDVNRGGSNG